MSLTTTFSAILPSAWSHGLTELPGYNPESRRISLTTHVEVNRDDHGEIVGFLGRAHPLVRRSLDRVRNLAFGGNAHAYQDPRVTAVQADVTVPTLLCTYLGRVMSRAGRELERVVAVQIAAQGEPVFFDEAADWLPLADRDRAINVSGIWADHFASWGDRAVETAKQQASIAFGRMVTELWEGWSDRLQAESDRLDTWFQQRVDEVTGKDKADAVQISLFDGKEVNDTMPDAGWRVYTEPQQRLAGFAADGSRPPALRSEADGVLRLYRQRVADLANRNALALPEIIPLGMLMIVPG